MAWLERERQRLPRRASLKHRRWIRTLFDRSQPGTGSLAVGCIRLVFRLVHDAGPSERSRVFVGVSPGSQIRGAVSRNRVKRRLRECYRLEQHILLPTITDRPEALALMLVYRSNVPLAFPVIRKDVRDALSALASRITL